MVRKLPIAVPSPARLIINFIGAAEAPNGYGTIYGNRQTRLKRQITDMTVGELIDAQVNWGSKAWVKANWGYSTASSAAGFGQIIRATLIGLCNDYPEISGTWRYDAALQDRLIFALLIRRGYMRFIAGTITLAQFGNELAKEWASFPVLEDMRGAHHQVKRGQSYYSGDGLNKALVKPEAVEELLRQVLAMVASPIAIEETAAPAQPPAQPPARPVDPEQLDKPLAKSKTVWQWLLTAAGAPLAAFGGFDWRVQLVIVAVIAGFAIYAIKRRADIAKVYRQIKAEVAGDGAA